MTRLFNYARHRFAIVTKPCPCSIQRIFSVAKSENFMGKKRYFNIFTQNIDCGYTLEPPHRIAEAVLTSTHKKKSMFYNKNKKNRYTQFCYIKVWFEGVSIARTCCPDVTRECHLNKLSLRTTISTLDRNVQRLQHYAKTFNFIQMCFEERKASIPAEEKGKITIVTIVYKMTIDVDHLRPEYNPKGFVTHVYVLNCEKEFLFV